MFADRVLDPLDSSEQEVYLQKDQEGNVNLHLILPAASVKFLNGFDENSFFNVDD